MDDRAVAELQATVERFCLWLEGRSQGMFRTRMSFLLFNFDVNSSVLKEEHGQFLAEAITLYGHLPGTTVRIEEVVGGASRTGDGNRNQVLSMERAEAVQAQLQLLGERYTFPAYGLASAQLVENTDDEDPLNRSVRVDFSLDHRRTWEDARRAEPSKDWWIDFTWGAGGSVAGGGSTAESLEKLDRIAGKLLRKGIPNAKNMVEWLRVERPSAAGRSIGVQFAIGNLTKLNALGEKEQRDIVAITLGVEWAVGLDVPVPWGGGGTISITNSDGYFETDEPTDFDRFDATPYLLLGVGANLPGVSGSFTGLWLPPNVGGGNGVLVPIAGLDVALGMDALKLGTSTAAGMLFVLEA